jgi:hypothetical protein
MGNKHHHHYHQPQVVYQTPPQVVAEINNLKNEIAAQKDPKKVPENIRKMKEIIWAQL